MLSYYEYTVEVLSHKNLQVLSTLTVRDLTSESAQWQAIRVVAKSTKPWTSSDSLVARIKDARPLRRF